jgi:integrase
MLDRAIALSVNELRLPTEVIDRAGRPVNLARSIWWLNSATSKITINWQNFPKTAAVLFPAAAKYIVHLIRTKSPWQCRGTFNEILGFARFLADFEEHQGPARAIQSSAFSEYRALLAAQAREYELHRVRCWFLWAADNGHEAFSPEVAFEIGQMRIPGNRKGTAVLSEDPEKGPLTEEEVIALLSALRSARADAILTLQQRTALWLCLALGRNPANYCLLQEQDLVTFKVDGVEATAHDLMVPRIKKRKAREREEYKRQKITPELAHLVQQLIAENATSRPVPADTPKWLFRRTTGNRQSMNGEDGEFSHLMYADEFTRMIADGVTKLGIKSPATDKPLEITTRRLRYTYATRLVDEGISHRGLAEALDHTDLQNILVYFNARSNIVRRIDAAIALQIAPLARAFARRDRRLRVQCREEQGSVQPHLPREHGGRKARRHRQLCVLQLLRVGPADRLLHLPEIPALARRTARGAPERSPRGP